MKKIELHGKYGEGKYALVSDEDYDLLKDLRWTVSAQGYAWNCTYRHRARYMHRLVADQWERTHKIVVDHINRNPLDNRRENLRITTQSHNSFNSKGKTNTGYKNIHLRDGGFEKFQRPLVLQFMYQRVHIGVAFASLDEALMNRTLIATQLWGEEYATFAD